MAVIYTPRGKAGEYAKLALNIYRGCDHKCKYCYAPRVLRMGKDDFHSPLPRKDILKQVEKDASIFKGNKSHITMSFTSDPYQHIDFKYKFTREAIKILHKNNLSVQIITKSGKRAERDFDLLTSNDILTTTMTFLDDNDSLEWEPNAALPEQRIEAIKNAKKKGIQTWVSLEPVIDPEQSLKIIEKVHKFVDFFKVGKLNYHPLSLKINWKTFGNEAIEILKKYNKKYYIKNDLKAYL
jgi:DNA repair photolyase